MINGDEQGHSIPPPPSKRTDVSAQLLHLADLLSIVALWFAAGTKYDGEDYQAYLHASVKNFVFEKSLFDVFCLGVGRSLILLILYHNVLLFKSNFRKFIAGFLPMASSVFLFVKLGLTATNDLNQVYGGAMFAGFILGTQLLVTFIETYNITRLKSFLETSDYLRLQNHKTDQEKAEQSRKDEEQDKYHTSIPRLLALARPEMGIISMGLVALFINSLSTSALPFIIGLVVDALVEGEVPSFPICPNNTDSSVEDFKKNVFLFNPRNQHICQSICSPKR